MAALTVYDMVKGLERGVEIAEVGLLEKTGGRHDWRRRSEGGGGDGLDSSLARGEGEDVSGPALAELCREAGLETSHETVSDDREAIAAALSGWPTTRGCASCSPPAAPGSPPTT